MSSCFYDPLLQELYEAALQLRPFLRVSNEPRLKLDDHNDIAEWLKKQSAMTEAEKLREEADEMDAQDAAIIRFRNALDAVGGEKP